jgi:SOS-response transcriptional repressor LexA
MSPKSMVQERIPVVSGFVLKHGRAPTLDELCTLFNVKSKNTASVMAAKFVEAGVLSRTATGRLSAPRQNPACKLRLLGSVAAGFPSPAEESLLTP